MSAVRKLLLPIVLLGGFVVAPCSQAETFHTCGNIIASLPTVLSSQGVYCLSHDLTTAITSGNAITVNINIARSVDEAERQARGENVIASQFEQEAQLAADTEESPAALRSSERCRFELSAGSFQSLTCSLDGIP